MFDLIKQFKDFIGWSSGLSLLPKITLSLIIVAVAGFFLALIWSKTESAAEPVDVTSNWVDRLKAQIDKGSIFGIKALMLENSEAALGVFQRRGGSGSPTVLADLAIEGNVFDIAIIPSTRMMTQVLPNIVLIKIMNPNRSPATPEGIAEVQKEHAIVNETSVAKALEVRDDYRENPPRSFNVSCIFLGGRRGIMSKSELTAAQEQNRTGFQIMTYDSYLESLTPAAAAKTGG